MVRPLSGPGAHWDAALANPRLFAVGNVLRLRPTGSSPARGLPHAREDLVVPPPEHIDQITRSDLPGSLAPSESASISSLFGEALIESRLVMSGSDCPSLGAVRLNSRRFGFTEKVKPDGTTQLRCWFYDAQDERYNLPVVSRELHAVHQTAGVEELIARRGPHRNAHIRIGLAHPFDDGRAFLMVNHVLFF